MRHKPSFFMVDGYEVSISFQQEKNPDIVSPLKQALIASYISGNKQNEICTFASLGTAEYDGKGGNTDAP